MRLFVLVVTLLLTVASLALAAVAPLTPPTIADSEEVSINQAKLTPVDLPVVPELKSVRYEAQAFYLVDQNQTGLVGFKFFRLIHDPVQVGRKISLAEDALQYKLGVGFITGQDFYSFSAVGDAILYLKEGPLFGFDPFVGGNLNLNILGSGGQLGGLGLQVYCGLLLNNNLTPYKTGLSLGYGSFSLMNGRQVTGWEFSVIQPVLF